MIKLIVGFGDTITKINVMYVNSCNITDDLISNQLSRQIKSKTKYERYDRTKMINETGCVAIISVSSIYTSIAIQTHLSQNLLFGRNKDSGTMQEVKVTVHCSYYYFQISKIHPKYRSRQQ